MKIKVRHVALVLSASALTATLIANAADPVLTDSMVDLANKPITQPIDLQQAGPNVMFILDDGGEMAGDMVPEALREHPYTNNPCAFNFNVNKLAYNPGYRYKEPVKSINTDGTVNRYNLLEIANYTNTEGNKKLILDGYKVGYSIPSSSTVEEAYTNYGIKTWDKYSAKQNYPSDLNSNDLWFDSEGGAYYYEYIGTASPVPTTYPVTDSLNGQSNKCGPASNWRRVYVKNLVDDSNDPSVTNTKKNYAIWFAFYRTRINMLKSAATLVFSEVDENFRIGFMSGTQSLLKRGDSDLTFLNSDRFTVAQKNLWLERVTKATSSGNTPPGMPWALSTAGRYFGGQLKGQTWQIGSYKSTIKAKDPVAYSCQKAFSVVAGAGYYERTSSVVGMQCTQGTNGVTACQLNGTPLLDTDSDSAARTVPWPYKDKDNTTYKSVLANTRTTGLLSDVAYYYNNTNIRPEMPAQVTMGTFVINLGEQGNLKWREDYDKCATPADCDYAILKEPALYPAKNVWWYKVKYDNVDFGAAVPSNPYPLKYVGDSGSSDVVGKMKIDDNWHAAVNGGGIYFNASSVDMLISNLGSAISAIAAASGSGTGASTTSMAFSNTTGSFVSSFRTVEWTGDLQRRSVDASTGAIGTTNAWTKSAGQQLNERVTAGDSRVIYTGASGALTPFKADNLTLVADLKSKKYFEAGAANTDTGLGGANALSQYDAYTPGAQAAATGESGAKNMISYLRGQRTNEMGYGNAPDKRLYRKRASVLGDMVNSPIVHVDNKPLMDFTDAGYSDTFKATIATRKPTVYVGANDGMLHAFDAANGSERWAFVPSAVLPNLYKLADAKYSSSDTLKNHRYFVDGHITVQDAYFDDKWHTVLIGGLGKGGRSYYALDITGDTPTLLWEFSHDDLGYTYGNAMITKLSGETDRNKQWVAIFGSGYNNKTDRGNGKTNLFVLDLKTGALKKQFTATDGNSDPVSSGMGWVNGWTGEGMQDSTVQHVYGGDLGGNVWRFDVTAATGTAPTKLAMLKDASGKAQPITSRPELGDILNTAGGKATQRAVYIGTGRYLGDTRVYDAANTKVKGDASDRSVQTVYAIRDDSAGLKSYTGSFRATSGAVAFSTSGDRDARTIQYAQVTASSPGWYMDLPAGERVTVMPLLFMGDQTTLVVASNLPDATFSEACKAGGQAYVYAMQTQPVGTVQSAAGTVFYFQAQVVGMSSGLLSTGQGVGLVGFDTGAVQNVRIDIRTSAGAAVRRSSWRELLN